jgi:hypothetical protein
MTDSIPLWLANMRELSGTKWAPGDESNPKIISWLNFIGSAFPKMADYCSSVAHDGVYFSWCGLTVGYCMAKAGIPPLFGSTDTSRFLWAAGWLGWGSPVTAPHCQGRPRGEGHDRGGGEAKRTSASDAAAIVSGTQRVAGGIMAEATWGLLAYRPDESWLE